jgi:glycosyltransferase involved in cell wall biosynthesis
MNNSELNILYLCADSGIPYWGSKGGSIHMREIVSCFAGKNCHVTVIAKDASNISAEGINYSTFDLPEVTEDRILPTLDQLFDEERILREFEDFHRNPEIEKLLEKIYNSDRSFDIIYERYSLFNIAGLRFSRRNNIPYILEVNAPLIEEASKYRHLALPNIAAAVEKSLFRNSDHIIAVSNEIRDFILGRSSRASVTVVPNGVRIDHFSSTGDLLNDNSSDQKFTIGFLGSLKPWHGVEILIDSFARIAGENDDCHLLIIGDNKKLDADLEKKCGDLEISNKVTFTGALDYNDVPGKLRQADVLVAPYPRIDDFYFSSLKVFEYMAAGKAIVASSIGQLSIVLTHEKTALLVPPGDAAALGKALTRLKNDPGLRKRLGERAQIDARRRHTWSQRADTILEIARKLKAGKQ